MNKLPLWALFLLIGISIALWVAICYGLTFVVIWLGKGLFSADLTAKFNYIWVALLLITWIIKRK